MEFSKLQTALKKKSTFAQNMRSASPVVATLPVPFFHFERSIRQINSCSMQVRMNEREPNVAILRQKLHRLYALVRFHVNSPLSLTHRAKFWKEILSVNGNYAEYQCVLQSRFFLANHSFIACISYFYFRYVSQMCISLQHSQVTYSPSQQNNIFDKPIGETLLSAFINNY